MSELEPMRRVNQISCRLGDLFDRNRLEIFPALAPMVGDLEKDNLLELAEALRDEKFSELIKKGRITCAMFKRPLYDKENPDKSEAEVAVALRQRIFESGISPVLEMSLMLDEKMLGEFYSEVKSRLIGMMPRKPGFQTEWERFVAEMTGGPVTFLILYVSPTPLDRDDERRKADLTWRTVIGATDPQQALPGTIRHDYASSIADGNLVHGSSAEESGAVRKEIEILADYLERLADG